MPFFIVIIVLAAIIFGTLMVTTIFKAFLNYLSSKHQPALPSSSLTTSELHGFIRDAVEEVNAPLLARIETLETRIDTLDASLPEARQSLLLDVSPEPFDADAPAASRRQRLS